MKRRDFMAVLGAGAAWPLAARSQQGERMRRVAFFNPLGFDIPATLLALAD